MNKMQLTQDTLHQLIEHKEGRYFWKQRPVELFKNNRGCSIWNAQNAGKELFTGSGNKYASASIFKRIYYAHRLIWLFHNGVWPTNEIDHINGDRSDNRIENLRDVPRNMNQRNKSINSNNTSGHVGVTWNKKRKKWYAQMTLNGRVIYLGCYSRIEDAISARMQASHKHDFCKHHGRAKAPDRMVQA